MVDKKKITSDKLEFLLGQKEQMDDLLEKVDEFKTAHNELRLPMIIKKMDIAEKIFNEKEKIKKTKALKVILKSKTVKDSYDVFKNIYKIETGEDYEI